MVVSITLNKEGLYQVSENTEVQVFMKSCDLLEFIGSLPENASITFDYMSLYTLLEYTTTLYL